MDIKQPLEQVVTKILEDASKTGVVSKEQLEIILLYERQTKQDKSILNTVVDNGEMILNFIEKLFK